MNQHRLEVYSDGIFAIAATLLILNFSLPLVSAGNNGQLMLRLIEQWPKAVVYLLSFGVIANYWRIHAAIFRYVKVVDHKTTMYNIMLLAMAAFVPYATNVAGTYPTLPAAAVLYSLVLLLAAIAGKAMAHHLITSNAYRGEAPIGARGADRRITVAIYVRVIGLVFAFFLPIVSYAIYWIMILYFVLGSELDVYSSAAEETVAV
ncbi:MAG: DUF1211 domain-containing protein [Candidatus Eremiobacteraeota bacterium]|nr:DUF1211 domain-containing protein [Candidatus Eremiobacteraeota bacterium]MBV9737873.1 DUF1211 domain-containing protein [Candidatus Eremiobacteraeota bacterium]